MRLAAYSEIHDCTFEQCVKCEDPGGDLAVVCAEQVDTLVAPLILLVLHHVVHCERQVVLLHVPRTNTSSHILRGTTTRPVVVQELHCQDV